MCPGVSWLLIIGIVSPYMGERELEATATKHLKG